MSENLGTDRLEREEEMRGADPERASEQTGSPQPPTGGEVGEQEEPAGETGGQPSGHGEAQSQDEQQKEEAA